MDIYVAGRGDFIKSSYREHRKLSMHKMLAMYLRPFFSLCIRQARKLASCLNTNNNGIILLAVQDPRRKI